MTVGMARFTWHIVTVTLLAFGTLLLMLAWADDVDPKTLLLRWLAALWLVALHRTQRRERGLRSDPMPFDTPMGSCLPGGPHGKLVAREPKTAR
jgi:hypothetical protein